MSRNVLLGTTESLEQRDNLQIALGIVNLGSEPMAKKSKNPHAVALGRLGGLKGGKARLAKLTSEERRELARKAVLARWAKEKLRRKNTPD